MTERDDHELLAEFARNQSEAAFATLARRHVNLVYSAALRFTANAHHAEEITQAVFVILARKADRLRRGTVVSGWLYQTARLTAANMVKGETRRQRREQEAYMQSTLGETDPAAWEKIAPLLDEAMGHLSETDRNAIVLRFFENRPAAEVATALKLTEAATHKRVNRAVDKLRKIFSQRGVTLTATVIAGAVAANSVQAAPVGLATNIAAAAIAGTTATTALIMTTIQKIAVTIALTASVGVGIYQVKEATKARAEVQTLRQNQAPLAEEIHVLKMDRDSATNRLAALADELTKANRNNFELLKLRSEVTRLRNEARAEAQSQNDVKTNGLAAALMSWLERVEQFKHLPERMPDKTIPELSLLKQEDWLELAKEPLEQNAKEVDMNDDAVARLVFRAVRAKAKDKLMRVLSRALEGYATANAGQLPTDMSELKPYLMNQHFLGPARVVDIPDNTIDDTILHRYSILHTGRLADVPSDSMILAEKAPVDSEYDTRLQVGRHWMGIMGIDAYSSEIHP